MLFIKRTFSIAFGLLSLYSVIAGFFILVSNIQGSRVYDGHPLDPWWLVVLLLVVIPIIAGAISISLYPKEN